MRADPPPESFEALALPFVEDVRRFAFSLTRDGDEAEDLVQDTFLKAFRSWDSFTPGNCRSWLFTICRNTFYRRFHRERKRDAIENDVGDPDALPTVLGHAQAHSLGLGDLFDRLDVRPAFRQALGRLPDAFREIVTLVDVEDLSYGEAADVLDLPLGTVRSRLFRARRRLQESLIDQAIDLGLAVPGAQRQSTDQPPADLVIPGECEGVVRGLWDLIDDELPPDRSARLQAHLEACESCRTHEVFERRLVGELARLRHEPVDGAALRLRVRATLEAAGSRH